MSGKYVDTCAGRPLHTEEMKHTVVEGLLLHNEDYLLVLKNKINVTYHSITTIKGNI